MSYGDLYWPLTARIGKARMVSLSPFGKLRVIMVSLSNHAGLVLMRKPEC